MVCQNISKVKRQPSEWEKIIANEATDKQLISKVYSYFTDPVPSLILLKTLCVWIYLWAFYFVPLIYMSVFVPVPYCLDLMRWPKYWSFSFNISPSNEHPGPISFRMDWLDLLVVQGTLKVLFNTTVQKHQFFGAPLFL